MTVKWKAFTIWFAFPYFVAVVVVPGILVLSRHDAPLASLSQWRNHVYVLLACTSPAGIGTIILWLLPIRRTWWGVMTGITLAGGGVILWLQLRTTFFGGFEANAGAAATAMTILLPSCLAGAYAGFLRSNELQVTT